MDIEDLIRSGKIKRFFRATRKLNVPQLVLHVTQRAAGKEPLFLEDADYLYLVWLLKEISTSHHLMIYAFCLMPNHLHLLFSTEGPNLYDAMRDLFARYATRFNRKYGRRGHLFGGPYRQAICLDDSYLIAASLYIHLNPVRANLADDPQRYRWSSCEQAKRWKSPSRRAPSILLTRGRWVSASASRCSRPSPGLRPSRQPFLPPVGT